MNGTSQSDARRLAGAIVLAAAGVCAGLGGLGACARVRLLEGGPADKTAPTFEGSSPADSSVGLPRRPRFELRFSEKLSQSSTKRGLRLYPPVRLEAPHLHGRTVTVTLADSLPPDTTFVLVVGKALEDQPPRGNHLAEERWLVFSTGRALHACAVLGRVTVKGVADPREAVAFLPVPADTARGAALRYPVAGTNAEGLFKMEGLPSQRRFRLLAFLDQNDNLYPDPGELSAACPETLRLASGEVRRGLVWNVVDPKEPGELSGVIVNASGVVGPVAVALRLGPSADSVEVGRRTGPVAAGPDSSRTGGTPPAAADTLRSAVRADTLRPRDLPAPPRAKSPWATAYAQLEPRGFVKRQWRVVYASPRGDYSIRVPPGSHFLVAFVDASRDSAPGLYVRSDSTALAWEPLWVGGALQVGPGSKLRPRTVNIGK